MILVVFEVRPAAGRQGDYLDLAATMRPIAESSPGFIAVERFQSLADPQKLLSLSAFEDEAALRRWRTMLPHRAVQSVGRAGLFEDYRLRIATVVRDYGLHDRREAPADSKIAHGA